MKVQKFFDDQAEASDSDDEEYDSAEDFPGSLAEFIVDDDLESKSEVRSLNSLLDSVSDSDSQSVKKRKLDHNSDSSSSDEAIDECQVKRKPGRPLGSKSPKVVPKKNVLPTKSKKASKSNDSKGRAKGKLFISFIKTSNYFIKLNYRVQQSFLFNQQLLYDYFERHKRCSFGVIGCPRGVFKEQHFKRWCGV